VKKEVKRYTLGFISNNNYVPIARSTLENIDTITTSFNNKEELTNFFEKYFDLGYKIDDVIVTYMHDKNVKTVKLIFKNEKDIVNDEQLPKRIDAYLYHYSNVLSLSNELDNLKNKFLKDQLQLMKSSGKNLGAYSGARRTIQREINKQYRQKRELALFIEDYKRRHNLKNLLIPPKDEDINMRKIEDCFQKVEFIYNHESKDTDIESEFLEYIISKNKDENLDLSKLLELYEVGILEVYDIEEMIVEKGRSK